jgi:hypothetical protein
MRLLCALAGHEAETTGIYNSGYYFSACRRCGADLIRSAHGEWQEVPPGHRVMWKSGRHSHSLDPDFAGSLPILHHEVQLPAVRSPFFSWSRDLTPLSRIGRPARVEDERPEEFQCSRLMLIAVLVGAGLNMLFGFGSARDRLA